MRRLRLQKARRLLRTYKNKDFSKKEWEWDVPIDVLKLSQQEKYKFDTFISFAQWSNNKKVFLMLVHNNEVIYLDEEFVDNICKQWRSFRK